MSKRLPQVGDIVLWTGFGGPQYVLILEAYDIENIYYVLSLDGRSIEDSEWMLTEHNSISWKVL